MVSILSQVRVSNYLIQTEVREGLRSDSRLKWNLTSL
jgi:hypothetical protein